ncbi:hypothetical protein HUT06_31745 [Actinomadura sp. NAK00032]|uniref:hypothetical protein n=1 Tax=Actinomadura sp. NAK00032 TaxID=2742128 RepID=UPI0015916BDA|nr:hypothetical protein [Actinomadura sp. NAK00032]QKW38008.1 hypothetical protein HUT06_31745 [Actinomadura sp. NAK00032]
MLGKVAYLPGDQEEDLVALASSRTRATSPPSVRPDQFLDLMLTKVRPLLTSQPIT